MHHVKTSIRKILPAELPTVTPIGETARPMNDQELLNMGLHRIGGDLFSCIHQEETDDDGNWSPKEGQSLPGAVVTEGTLKDRHARLPASVRGRILRATIIRSSVRGKTAKDAAAANLTEVATALAENVGDVDGAPLVDTASPEAALKEAQRLVDTEASGLERDTVPMVDVTDGDFVEGDSLIPHSWAGEPRR